MGVGRRRAVDEHAAEGELARVYHEIRQRLRMPGVDRTIEEWARSERLFPLVWRALRPNVETRAFEDAADELRRRASEAAAALGAVSALGGAGLGESQQYHVRGAVDLHHYAAPKLLLLAAMTASALSGELRGPGPTSGSGARSLDVLVPGAPVGMAPLEVVAEPQRDPRVRALFGQLEAAFGGSVATPFRALALWPEYLDASWRSLRPFVAAEAFRSAAGALGALARSLTATLPYPVLPPDGELRDAAAEREELARAALESAERLPAVTLAVALLKLELSPVEKAVASPFPPSFRTASGELSA